jgi:hypothetical protein
MSHAGAMDIADVLADAAQQSYVFFALNSRTNVRHVGYPDFSITLILTLSRLGARGLEKCERYLPLFNVFAACWIAATIF